MSDRSTEPNRRILVVDDSPAIHEDFRKILAGERAGGLAAARAAFLGEAEVPAESKLPSFEVDSAYQGQEALGLVRQAIEGERPYAMAFVNVRMPPGWDGIETIERLWEVAPDLQTVVCTAFSDYSWEETLDRLGQTDRLLILKKPFDPVEISQLAAALSEKWNVERRVESLIGDLKRKEQEARAYASSLETVNRALETSKAAAEKSSEMKSDFLIHLSREIRSKVSGMAGDVERLRLPDGAHVPAEATLDSVFFSTRHLLSTLDEVADIALIDSGKLEVRRREFEPSEPMNQVSAELRERAEAKGLELWVESRGPLPEQVRSDPDRIAQVLRDLLSNAVSYTRTGSIRMTLEAEGGEYRRGVRLRYTVEDTGAGIPRDRLGRLFEPFAGALDQEEGAGLGLAHAQRLARLLGGDIRVESEHGRGSRFYLSVEASTRDGAERS